MYLQHFGLAQHPFSLTPNTRFFLKLPSHQQAFNGLVAALNGPGHFSTIVGEVGTGKTMLCRKFLNALERHRGRFITVFVPHPILSEEGIMHTIAEELGIEFPAESSYYDMLKLISAYLVKQADEKRRVILFIDEAQAMPEETLKAVYLLTQVKIDERRQLRVILFGQPELDKLLEHNALQPLLEEITFTFRLSTLDRDGTAAYVEHRLSKAGYCGPQMLTEQALELLFEASKGTPRLINILCNKALMVAFGKGDLIISDTHLASAIADTVAARREKGWTERLFPSP